VRRLSITAAVEEQKVIIRIRDSGPGSTRRDRLFAPFQPGADGAGVGLYVSRAVMRGYGGDLRWSRVTAAPALRLNPEIAGRRP